MKVSHTHFLLSLWLVTVLMSACATSTNYSEGGNPIPEDWVTENDRSPNECVAIEGDYKTHGLGRLKKTDSLVDTRLDVVLGHVFPSSKIPEWVTISVDLRAGMLRYQFAPSSSKEYLIPTKCTDGWYMSEKRLSNEYIGEGGTLDHSIRKIELTKALNGDLIIHLLLESKSTSFLVLATQDKREVWSRYEPYKAK